MTVDTAATSVAQTIDVAAPAEHVFDVFTMRMNSWWETTHHLIPNVTEMVVEPHAGGTITDVSADGGRCTWGRVLAFERPTRFAFSWDISLRWEVETDRARCSEVYVTFVPTSDTTTRVELEHKYLDRHGDGWESMRDAVGGPQGWVLGLTKLAEVAAAG